MDNWTVNNAKNQRIKHMLGLPPYVRSSGLPLVADLQVVNSVGGVYLTKVNLNFVADNTISSREMVFLIKTET